MSERGVEIMRMALAETVPGFVPESLYEITFEGRQVLVGNVDSDLGRRARLLGSLGTRGPDAPTLCRDHDLPGRFDLWDACAKVPVREALIGRTCGVPA